MSEYFVHATSGAAPIVSDASFTYVEAESPDDALVKFVASYAHPAGLYVARCYGSADAYHRNEPHLEQWLSERAVKAGWAA